MPIQYAKEATQQQQQQKKRVCIKKIHMQHARQFCDLEVANTEYLFIPGKKKKTLLNNAKQYILYLAEENNAIALYWALHCCIKPDPATHRNHLQCRWLHQDLEQTNNLPMLKEIKNKILNEKKSQRNKQGTKIKHRNSMWQTWKQYIFCNGHLVSGHLVSDTVITKLKERKSLWHHWISKWLTQAIPELMFSLTFFYVNIFFHCSFLFFGQVLFCLFLVCLFLVGWGFFRFFVGF